VVHLSASQSKATPVLYKKTAAMPTLLLSGADRIPEQATKWASLYISCWQLAAQAVCHQRFKGPVQGHSAARLLLTDCEDGAEDDKVLRNVEEPVSFVLSVAVE